MKPERNAPCPCGSGKKYKKCCGLSSGRDRKPDYFAFNRTVAYQGAVGRQRETFCIDYTTFKTAKFLEIERTLKQEIASTGATISCSRGCAHCCTQFVVASLQECECITYYLYHHNSALEHFIQAFDDWRSRILKNESCFRKINDLGEKINLGQATDEDRRLFTEESRVYARQNNPCPFLVEGVCSIYAVRPYICANYFSISPPEWCQPAHPNTRQAVHMKIGLQLGNDLSYFALPAGNRIVSPMPFMVYRILAEGYDALYSITGAERLREHA